MPAQKDPDDIRLMPYGSCIETHFRVFSHTFFYRMYILYVHASAHTAYACFASSCSIRPVIYCSIWAFGISSGISSSEYR